MLTAASVFIFTLALVIWQPKGLSIGWSASIGAVLALLFGVVSPSDIYVVWGIVWNATAAFVAIIIISLILDEAGFFKWAALHVARWGQGNARLLFALIVILGAVVSALFANDGAALILTPIVMAMLLALGFNAAATLAFVMAAGFIADTASLPLIVSNLVNIVSADFFDIGFSSYAKVMVPVTIVSIIISLLVLFAYFYRHIPTSYSLTQLDKPASAITDISTFKAGWVILPVVLAGFFGLEQFNIPVSAVAALGALSLYIVAYKSKTIDTRKVISNAPWAVVIFSLGMYLVVYGLRNAGLTQYLSNVLSVLSEQSTFVATIGTGVISAFLSAIMNNMPTVLIGALSIDASSASGTIKEAMIYANIIGSDLGPKFTPIGSLATLLWLHVLQKKGLVITWSYYLRVGLILTLPVLLATLAALSVWVSI